MTSKELRERLHYLVNRFQRLANSAEADADSLLEGEEKQFYKGRVFAYRTARREVDKLLNEATPKWGKIKK
jgi:hypothetical protein